MSDRKHHFVPIAISFLIQQIPISTVWIRLIVLSGLSFLTCAICVYLLLLEKEEQRFIISRLSHIMNK